MFPSPKLNPAILSKTTLNFDRIAGLQDEQNSFVLFVATLLPRLRLGRLVF
jgi:hypothetical protein